ncbi:MAG: hypothetical protein QXM23_06815 [Archaeoglobaceae archaeon]
MNDLIPLLAVYFYVGFLVLISERAIKNELIGRCDFDGHRCD